MSKKVDVRVLTGDVDGKKKGETLSISARSAERLASIGYVAIIDKPVKKAAAPKKPAKATTAKKTTTKKATAKKTTAKKEDK